MTINDAMVFAASQTLADSPSQPHITTAHFIHRCLEFVRCSRGLRRLSSRHRATVGVAGRKCLMIWTVSMQDDIFIKQH